jgi:hypothetical protein
MPTPAGVTWAHGPVVKTGAARAQQAGRHPGARKLRQLQEDAMRSHYIIAIALVLAVGYGATRLVVASPTAANADAVQGVGLDVSRMHVGRELPAETTSDMSFVAFQAD